MKRLFIATFLGLLFGFVCYGFASSGGNEVSWQLTLNIIFGRTLIGFAIGISRFKMGHWAVHGLAMGLIIGIPSAFGAMLGPDNPEFNHNMMFISTLVMGMVYGFLIELITSLVFKERI